MSENTYNWEALAAPFDESELEWRPGYVFEDRDDPLKGNALALPYIQNRAVMERLDQIIGQENWKNEKPEPGPQGGVIMGLSIRVNGEWITKWDGADSTDIEAVKGGLSDAMKRSAVHWGIGRYLYNLPMINHPVKRSDPKAKNWKFVGTPKLPTGSSSSKLADPRPSRLDTFDRSGTHEKPATARGATSSRPFGSVEDLAKHLIASKAQQKAKDSLISEGQAKNIGKELGILFKSDEIRAYFLWRVFQIEPDEEGRLSKYMDEKEFFTIKGWLASPLGVLEHEVGVVVSEYTSEAEEKQRG